MGGIRSALLQALGGNWKSQTRLHISEAALRGIVDEQARHIMNKTAGESNAEGRLKLLESKQSKAILRMQKSNSLLQLISRLSGISVARIRKILVV